MSVTVADVMTHQPLVVEQKTPLNEAIKLMAEHKIGSLPVVDNGGQLVGVLSESDVMWQESGMETPPYLAILDGTIFLKNPLDFARELHKAIGQTVGEVMGKAIAAIPPSTSMREAARRLHEGGPGCVVAVNPEGQPVGVLTRSDIIRAMAAGLS